MQDREHRLGGLIALGRRRAERLTASEHTGIDVNAKLSGSLGGPKVVPFRQPTPDSPIRDGSLSDASRLADGASSTKGVDQFRYGANSHAATDSPDLLDLSSRRTAGLTVQTGWRMISNMKNAVRDLDSIAARVRALRLGSGLNQVQAAERCGISKTTWNNYERGVARPDVDNAAAMCEAFGVDLNWLYAGSTQGLPQTTLDRLFGKRA